MYAKSFQSCPTLCYPVDCSPPGSYAHGILYSRILECIAMTFSRGSFKPMNRTCISCILHWQASILPLATSGKLNMEYKLLSITYLQQYVGNLHLSHQPFDFLDNCLFPLILQESHLNKVILQSLHIKRLTYKLTYNALMSQK